MTIQQLEYIVALDESRHFVTAAEKCFVTQPTLTMQVKKLELEAGVIIFDRRKQPLKPTKVGAEFISKARQVLREVKQLKEVIIDNKEKVEGTFRVGIIPTLAPYLIPLFLPRFLEHHKETKLVIKELKTEEIISDLNNDYLDIGILSGPLDEFQLKEKPLFHEPFVLYDNKENKSQSTIKKEEIDSQKLLLMAEGHCLRNQILNICGEAAIDNKNARLEVGSIETLKGMVKNNLGYSLIPELSIKEEDRNYIKRFELPHPARLVSMVYHYGFVRHKVLDNLKDSILKTLPKELLSEESDTTIINWK